MIPKVIHYCWFGRNPLPGSVGKCIASWRRFLPDYEIKEWNEDNFDVDIIPYTAQAYAAKKYAFVSDYARFWILYHFGGLYFDTDVEIIKSFDDIVEGGPFMGIEIPSENGIPPMVAPGLGLGVTPGHNLYKFILDKYSSLSFLKSDGSLNQTTVVSYTTDILVERGLQANNGKQLIDGVCIYPVDFFNPFNSITGKLQITENTRSIHWYMDSWGDKSILYKWLSRMAHRLLGKVICWLKVMIKR